MSVRTRLGLSGESSLEEGEPDEVLEKKRKALDERLRPARLEAARRQPKWTEIDNDLVPRDRGWLVSAETDAIYTLARGVVFQPHSITVIAHQTELSFYVDREGDLVFLERQPATWSVIVAKRAKRGQAPA